MGTYSGLSAEYQEATGRYERARRLFGLAIDSYRKTRHRGSTRMAGLATLLEEHYLRLKR